MSAGSKPHIALLVSKDTSASVLYGLYDVLFSVGGVYPDMTLGQAGEERLEVSIVAATDKPFRCVGNVPVEPQAGVDHVKNPDVVVVCDMYTPIHASPTGRYAKEVEWLRRMHAGGALVCSVCSGSILLAEAGLLDGKDAAAHWAYRDMFQRCYPKTNYRVDSMLCLSAEPDRVITAGGVTAWHDLAVYLIGRYCGQRQAIETAKVFLISGHAEGQLPYAVMTRPMENADNTIGACQEWIADNYKVKNPVESMVERSGLSARTFARRFRAATGYAPIDYIQSLRIEEAKQMLETEAASVDEIGASVGYEDSSFFRRIFKRNVGLSPAAYRRKFQQIGSFG